MRTCKNNKDDKHLDGVVKVQLLPLFIYLITVISLGIFIKLL